MHRIKKIFFISLIIIISYSIGYYVGYFNGVNSTVFFESSIVATENIHTIKYLEKNQLDKAKSVLTSRIRASMAAIEDIYGNRNKISRIPGRIMDYREMLSLDMETSIDILRKKYNDLAIELGWDNGDPRD